MTLAQAVTKFQSRFRVYQHCDFDHADPNLVVAALNSAAEQVADDCLHLWETNAPIRLTAGTTLYNLTDPAVCADRVFLPYGIYINGGWLYESDPDIFVGSHPDLPSESQNANPSDFTMYAPNKVEIAPPPNATAVAATNYCTGFRFPAVLAWPADQDTELEGVAAFHDLIVDRAYLSNSMSFGLSEEALQQRAIIEQNYERRKKDYRQQNLSRYRKIRRRASRIGTTRRMVGVGDLI